MKQQRQITGFTLIELLVVLVVFSLLALMSYRGLSTVLDTRSYVKGETEKWHRMSMFFARFSQDLAFVSPRLVRSSEDMSSTLPALLGDPSRADGAFSGAYLEFSRIALAESTEGPQRVAYALNGKKEIELRLWPSLDNAPGAPASRHVVLKDVALFEVRYLDANLVWVMSWPASADTAALPRAVQLHIVLISGEDITRVFAL